VPNWTGRKEIANQTKSIYLVLAERSQELSEVPDTASAGWYEGRVPY